MATKRLSCALVLGLAWVLTAPIGQGFFVYLNFPSYLWLDFASAADELGNTANVYINSTNGVHIGLWHTQLHGAANRSKVVLYLHGNGEHRASAVGLEKHHLYRTMPSVSDIVLVDYRGFGDSSRVWPTEQGVKDDAMAAWTWLTQVLGRSHSDIVVHGYSLGSAIATHLVHTLCARQQCPAGLILEAPFTTISGIVRDWVPAVADDTVSSLLAHQFRTKDLLRAVNATPILLVHGKKDRIVAFHHGQTLYERHGHNNLRFCPVADAGHMDTFAFEEGQRCLHAYWHAAISST
ncbi:hypothetical protein SDRG_01378 [Saprolegnia diclina VS20]|uniref:AB hydrolase-1 domain-containing protein n=1 Tax=Saprolegnia diclina (strain VS20) TaxID=1156394 RepID=T0QTA8_SAPDV|nr:hypothetical protein SDRG_01378 [Saprolegnia diclina VS20]EQC41409.1 hypothetical protein SDRG_01378 [Saprolegnia diclina VS20]|eukprot:XP_008605123.1 hypothetical protein SDRG_01378 [Saprolegnia diclina VS20]